MTDQPIEAVRLAGPRDYPAERLIGLETRISTGDHFMDAFDVAERTLGETVPQGALFAYLFRRFGHPNKGSDPDKEFVSYLLTTTHPEMLLRITPYAGGDVSIGFCFLVPHAVRQACDDWISRDRDAHAASFLDWIEAQGRVPDWADETADAMAAQGWPIPEGATGWRRVMTGIAMIAYGGVKKDDPEDKADAIHWYERVRADYEAIAPVPPVQWRAGRIEDWEEDDPMRPFADAMVSTLTDLRRPVWIRDVAIDIRGPVDEDATGDGPDLPDAEPAPSSGYPLGVLGNHDPIGFAILADAVLEIDPDPSTAMRRAVAILTTAREAIVDETAKGATAS